MPRAIYTKLSSIRVSELIVLLVLFMFLATTAIVQAQANTFFRLAILPPSPPTILSVLGDPQHRTVVILGQSKEKDALINLYNIADPSVATTKTNPDGSFAVVLGETSIHPGDAIFVATAVIHGNYVTDPGNRVALEVNEDFSVAKTPNQDTSVYIGVSDAVTTQLIGSLGKNPETTVVPIPSSNLPTVNLKAKASQRLQIALFALLFTLFFSILLRRATRKKREGKNFFSLGRGIYRLPVAPPR